MSLVVELRPQLNNGYCFFNSFSSKDQDSGMRYCQHERIGKIFNCLGIVQRIDYQENQKNKYIYIYTYSFNKFINKFAPAKINDWKIDNTKPAKKIEYACSARIQMQLEHSPFNI